MTVSNNSQCPSCGQPVLPHWRICPVCETRLQESACPSCGQPVKENWKRCPECEAQLICPGCGRRIPKGGSACPHCRQPSVPVEDAPQAVFLDPVCGMEMVYIPGGNYQMGDTLGAGMENEYPVHQVALAGFYIARFPVTQGQWQRLIPENPSRFQGERRPVEQVTWNEARRFAELLTQAQPDGCRFDLPTEAQWEYAARSGGKDELYAGGSEIQAVAWFGENSNGQSHDVGLKNPNGLELFDMSGNVWEWCRDTFMADAYANHATRDPYVDAAGEDRVIRGGSWHLDAWSARCARRFSCSCDYLGGGLGFRLIMVPNAS